MFQSSVINEGSNKHFWASTLCKAVSDLKQLLMEDEGSVSAYEIYSSGLVEVLLQLLTTDSHNQSDEAAELQKCRVDIFVKCFKVGKYIFYNNCILKNTLYQSFVSLKYCHSTNFIILKLL